MILQQPEIDKTTDHLNTFIAKKRHTVLENQKVCLSYLMNDDSITIFENMADPCDSEEIQVSPIAKIRYLKSKDCWRAELLNEDVEWHPYEAEPDIEAEAFEKALELVHEKLKARYV